jgi:thioredoxin-related protein
MKQALMKNFDWIRNISFLILMFLFFSACTVNNTAENVAIIEKYVSAVESQDYSTMEILLAEDYKAYGPSHSDSTNKENALAAWKYNIETLYENISYERSQIVALNVLSGPNKGEWVANWAELKITYKDGSGPIVIWANSNYKIENGKIVKSYTFYNEADALGQLGYVFVSIDEL